jgi:hypothetical protein
MPFGPWAILATQVLVGPSKKYRENYFTSHFGQNFTMDSYRVGFDVLGVVGKLVKYEVYLSKRKKNQKLFLLSHGAQTTNNQF